MSRILTEDECWLTWEEDEAILNFSEGFMKEFGWEEGQEVEFEILDNDTVVIRKKDEQQ